MAGSGTVWDVRCGARGPRRGATRSFLSPGYRSAARGARGAERSAARPEAWGRRGDESRGPAPGPLCGGLVPWAGARGALVSGRSEDRAWSRRGGGGCVGSPLPGAWCPVAGAGPGPAAGGAAPRGGGGGRGRRGAGGRAGGGRAAPRAPRPVSGGCTRGAHRPAAGQGQSSVCRAPLGFLYRLGPGPETRVSVLRSGFWLGPAPTGRGPQAPIPDMSELALGCAEPVRGVGFRPDRAG